MTSFYHIRFLQGFAFLRKLGLLLFKPQWDIKEKMKWIPLVAKRCHRVNSQLGPVAPVALQQLRIDPYVSQFFCFRAQKVPNFVCSYFSTPITWGLPKTERSPLMRRKVAPSRRVTHLPQLPWTIQNFLHFVTETWRLNTLETNSGLEHFFNGKVTFLAKPGQLGQGERIRPCGSDVFSSRLGQRGQLFII